jgi:fatty-acid peroxygenase
MEKREGEETITIPRVAIPDCTLPLLLEGYQFVPRRCRLFHSDLFRGRVLGEPIVFMSGPEAARTFYDATLFRRADATPRLVQKTLFGSGGVQMLDDEAHRRRKDMFLSLMSKGSIERFLMLVQGEWDGAIAAWQDQQQIVLIDQAGVLLCRAALRWSGLPADEPDASRLARDCAAMVGGFASLGPRMWRARKARVRREGWARDIIERIRNKGLEVEAGSAARVIAEHVQQDGERLPVEVAAVELLNVIRPIVAIGQWIAYLALALRDHPRYRERLRSDAALVEAFVQEVRRFYPFTPFVGARARKRFVWRGARFEEGMMALLDVYGALHDVRLWDRPDEFSPERFLDFTPGPFDFIPQGGGDFETGHRCAGEWLTIEVLKQALKVLTRSIRYELPAQDMRYSLAEMPTAPRSGVILQQVTRVETVTASFDPARIRGTDGSQPRP